jgi:intraflagellar transport protein 140
MISQQWEKAIKLCEQHRRIQLKTTYHAYAKNLESQKKIPEAIDMYEKAETHRYEVPRMLLDEPDQLQAYVVKKKDKYETVSIIQSIIRRTNEN